MNDFLKSINKFKWEGEIMGNVKENVIYEPFSNLEEQKASEESIKKEMEFMEKENFKLLKQVKDEDLQEQREEEFSNKKFKLVKITD